MERSNPKSRDLNEAIVPEVDLEQRTLVAQRDALHPLDTLQATPTLVAELPTPDALE
jgi:hypothetical protein